MTRLLPYTSQWLRWSPHVTTLVIVASTVSAVPGQSPDPVRIQSDVPYKSNAATEYDCERCRLDLYLPKDRQGFATIVWFHGGSLQRGDKAGQIAVALAKRFAADGVAVASANYRLHPQVQFPAYIEDAAAAVAFVQSTIGDYGGSSQRIFVSGHSAGGYLAAMVGLDESYLAVHGKQLSDIAGLIPIAGQMVTHSTVRQERGISRTRPLIDAAAPAYHARQDVPPCLNVVGSDDLPARAEENRYFVAVMQAAGHGDATYLEVAGRNHGTIASGIAAADDTVAEAMLAFIDRQEH